MATVKSAKSLLRKNMKQKLALISAESLSVQSLAVTKYVLDHQVYKNSKTVACYLSMSTGEIQTDRIVRSILADGKTLYVPRIVKVPPPEPSAVPTTTTTLASSPTPGSSTTTETKATRAPTSYMDFFKIHSVDDLEKNLVSGVWGIREPSELYEGQKRTSALTRERLEGANETIDLVLLPGMAFDRSLARLGHGKGYYDRFITEYRKLLSTLASTTTSPTLLGLSLEEQMVEGETIPMSETDVYLDGLITPTGTVPPTSLTSATQ